VGKTAFDFAEKKKALPLPIFLNINFHKKWNL